MRITFVVLAFALLMVWIWREAAPGTEAGNLTPSNAPQAAHSSEDDMGIESFHPPESNRLPYRQSSTSPFPVELVHLRKNEHPIPSGLGLKAWQTYYDWFKTPEGNMDSQKDGVRREWWMVDQEILAMARASLTESMQQSKQFFDSHRSDEEAMGDRDPGLVILKQNIDRYSDQLGSMAWNLDWLLEQDPHSDVARHLSNYLVSQARNTGSSEEYYNQTSPFQKLNFPIEVHLERVSEIDFNSLSAGAQTRLRDSYALLLLEGAENKSNLQVAMGAIARSTRQLGLPYPAGISLGAQISPDLVAGQKAFDQRWFEFMQEITTEVH
jgi:hypothetical protein